MIKISTFKGFTLIELILVVALMLILGVSSSVFYSRFFLQSSVAMTEDRVVASLRKAQMYSMSGKRGDAWSVNYGSNTLTLYKGSDFGGRDTAFDEKYEIGENIIITGLSNVSFARGSGVPSSSLIIEISGGGNSKQVSLSSQGVVER